MKGRINPTKKGAAPLITLLVLAISPALTASIGMAVLKLVEETLPKDTIPVIVAQRETSIEITNTASIPVNLTSLQIYINNRQASISDENGNRIWEPNEKLRIDLGQLEDVAVVQIIYENQIVYKAVYFKPVTLYQDTAFPEITYTSENSSYSVNVSDDTSIVSVNIYAGYEDGERLIFGFSPLAKGEMDQLMECYNNYRQTGNWTCQVKTAQFTLEWAKEGNGTLITMIYSGNEYRSSSDKKAYFARVETSDITGKASSVVLAIDSPPSVVLTSPPKGAKYVTPNPVNITISAVAEDDLKVVRIELYLDNTLLKTCENATSCSTVAPEVGPGRHTAMAIAYDTAGQASTDIANFEVDSDAPPVVSINSPRNGANLPAVNGTASFTISVSASDDFGLSSVDIYMDYLKLDSYQLNGDREFSIDIPANASEGNHVIEAFAFDVSGKNSSARVSFTVIEPHMRIFTVTVPPTSWRNQTPTNVSQTYTPKPVRITILSPTPGSYYGSSSTVNVTASVTSDYGLNRIVVYHNGIAYTAYSNLNGTKNYTFTYLASCARGNYFVSGTNEIRIFAYDTAGNVESAAVKFTANPR